MTRKGKERAAPELLVLARWEEFVAAFLRTTSRWPKSVRFTLTQRLQNHALDVLELLVRGRYDRAARTRVLDEANLVLERMRYLLRIARAGSVMSARRHEKTVRGIDEAGRMLYGWRKAAKGGR